MVTPHDPLPRPNVDVTVGTTPDLRPSVDVRISREGRGRAYTGVGGTPAEATREVIREILDDAYSAEWLPEPKKP